MPGHVLGASLRICPAAALSFYDKKPSNNRDMSSNASNRLFHDRRAGSLEEIKTKKNRRCGNSTKYGDDAGGHAAGARVTCRDEKSHKAEKGDPRMDTMDSKTKRFETRERAGVDGGRARIGRRFPQAGVWQFQCLQQHDFRFTLTLCDAMLFVRSLVKLWAWKP
ncbi:hypothetical protein F5B22DRAFT_649486 [Xylaria bambusicola]|uniref:uncharacterized protein n=1 Tax=Xylaria bambusicola TaxID=326684 RepID=UPI0020082981|nr:uncharacterized protein F5B22DRAFT_649486 [Xylaria bambusicola]KAI0508987.1 hypothetical protein F5B22DRAFT_649486 [Xylaria bambusicola]